MRITEIADVEKGFIYLIDENRKIVGCRDLNGNILNENSEIVGNLNTDRYTRIMALYDAQLNSDK